MRCTHINRSPVLGASLGQCERECLPELVVCDEHATRDALVLLIRMQDRELRELRREVNDDS